MTNWDEAPSGRTKVSVKRYGQQGKYKAVYHFNSRPINKIISQSQLDELMADTSYAVIKEVRYA
jgi:hypothetical protein